VREQPKRRKKAVNLSIDTELSRTKANNQRRWRKWREENCAAIEASNEELGRNGMWYRPEWLSQTKS
jgi:hypothetical protein